MKLPLIQVPEATMEHMTPGEMYTIQISTVSYGVESNRYLERNHTVRKCMTNLVLYFKLRIKIYFYYKQNGLQLR